MKHTSTPWQVLPEEHDKPYVRIRGTQLGCRYKIANVHAVTYEGASEREAEETRANAKRIVDCVNACADMDNPADYIDKLQNDVDRLRTEIGLLKVAQHFQTQMIANTPYTPLTFTAASFVSQYFNKELGVQLSRNKEYTK